MVKNFEVHAVDQLFGVVVLKFLLGVLLRHHAKRNSCLFRLFGPSLKFCHHLQIAAVLSRLQTQGSP